MRTLGLLGGMSWESTVTYYQVINRRIAAELGGLHSARLLLYSLDFGELEIMQREDRWDDMAARLCDAASALERAGAELLVICTNTMHKVAPRLEASSAIPLLHIIDPTGEAIIAAGHKKVGLLGTRFTMEQDFYRGRLEGFGVDVLVPGESSRARVHDIIYSELCVGVISESSRASLVEVVSALVGAGAEAVVMGCTEVGLLLRPSDVSVPLFDTTVLHAEAAALASLGGRPL